MMNSPNADQPVTVHVASAEPGVMAGAPAGRKYYSTFDTIVLTATNPVAELCGQEESRCYILAQAGGNNVVVASTKAVAQNPANQVAGQPEPQGAVLPAGNTVPTKIPGTTTLYAAAAQYPAQVSVIRVYEASS